MSPPKRRFDLVEAGEASTKKCRISKTIQQHKEVKPTEYSQSSNDQEDGGSTGLASSTDEVLVTKPHAIRELLSWHMPEIEGGDVYYIPNFVTPEIADEWYSALLELPWYHPTLKVYGKDVSQSRSIAAYATDKSMIVKYSGHTVNLHHEYPPLLTMIQKKVEAKLGEVFNHVMLNRYDNGKEYIGKHRDTKENKVIASLSLGAKRTFILSPSKSATGSKTHRWVLGNGSLLVMKGATQDNWKHEIPKEAKIKDGRISLTFRQLAFD